jgi:hypothetical protein
MQENVDTKGLTFAEKKYTDAFFQLKDKHKVAEMFSVSVDTVREHIAKAKKKDRELCSEIELIELERRKTEKVHSDGVASPQELYALIIAQDYKCSLTGECIKDASKAALDHIQPLKSGGTNRVSNLQWVLKEVNRMKGTMEQGEFISLCCKVADYARSKQ